MIYLLKHLPIVYPSINKSYNYLPCSLFYYYMELYLLFCFVTSEMASQFLEQVQLLMHTQQIKNEESDNNRNNHYKWLCKRNAPIIWMSVKDEFLIRHALGKVTEDQKVQVMKQLLTWMDSNPHIHCLKIPEMCLKLLNQMANFNMMSEVTVSRINSFRMSLRRLSMFSNRINPEDNHTPNAKIRRSVTFNDEPVVYKITNR